VSLYAWRSLRDRSKLVLLKRLRSRMASCRSLSMVRSSFQALLVRALWEDARRGRTDVASCSNFMAFAKSTWRRSRSCT
jgi:hypothetical protein